ncbi:glutamine amidotransferase [Singulisphaera sp. PoT]|uniref:glutamine amidotransferase n=1 Tax=Singulisphaera sp. PoT TaxID=3411797 RepID=UPI003BF6021A
MTRVPLIWGSPDWLWVALGLLGVAAIAILLSYARRSGTASPRIRLLCALLKTLGIAALAICLLEPLLTGSKPKSGANAFVVLADNSQSLGIRDEKADRSRGDLLKDRLAKEAPWRTRLGQDFDTRNYLFDTHLRATDGFEALAFDGESSTLNASLAALSRRFKGLPLAGVLLFTDGNRTDAGEIDVDALGLPPIYPVIPPSNGASKDVGLQNVSISQTNFESAPVALRADVNASGFAGESIVAAVTDESGRDVERQEATASSDGKPLSFRFQFRPEHEGINFYRVRAFPARDETAMKQAEANPPGTTREQTLANNSRLVVVDQGSEPYRILYVGGRPNWEYKFLRRSLDEDKQVQLVGLLRIALRQPKFDFRDPRDQSTNQFFKGFDNPDAETAERQDQPVLVRIGTEDAAELRDGFPKTAEELYRYHAIIIDDLESGFFTQDQLTLIRSFVARRGGGLLMLGGPNSFADGKYDRTPVGDILPVYLNARTPASPSGPDETFRLVLTREGWLQPWVRMRKTEDEEKARLASMPGFHTMSKVGQIKPGAVVLSEVQEGSGQTIPALVAQQFGKGHVAALMIGDLWRWGLRREKVEESDLERSWRQTVRWLVADVPNRVEASVNPKPEAPSAVSVVVKVNDGEYRPLDNAKVTLKIVHAGSPDLTIEAEPVGNEAGTYVATYVAKQPGAYRVVASATAPDGSQLGEKTAGWAAQPAADEFARLEPDRDFLKKLAAKTQGEVVEADQLDSFVKSLPSRKVPLTEPWTSPLWHQPLYFLIAIICLTAEWGLRRINGLA